MRNLPLPSREAAREDLVRAIKQYRYRGEVKGHTITPRELTAVLALYDRYDVDGAKPRDVLRGNGFPASLLNAIYDAYHATQEGRKLHSIRELVFKGSKLCPICGIDPAVELDHHLPRSIFKPLAIYARNLVPMCHACNHAKLAGFGDEGETGFLHAYFDTLPDIDFLQAVINIQNGALLVKFQIDERADLPDGYDARLSEQIRTLRLNARYEGEVNTYLSGQAISLHVHHRAGGAAGVRAYLSLQARYETHAFYRNHWRPTLLRALAAHNDFTDGGFSTVLPVPEDILIDVAGLP
ncbi:HNH endonuclease [Sinorhizobium fredii]|uniref:HNH endonuclease n=1 Tax=Rhizobium fredii TaxID=380 RepID=UPI00056BB33F|nr:HNH endonuclease signature motif containing protein [Sinorhizobium fredii]